MVNKMKELYFPVLFIGMIFFGMELHARPPHGVMRSPFEQDMPRMKRELSLTDEQVEKIKTVHKNMDEVRERQFPKLRKQHEKLEELLEKDKVDRKAVRAQLEKISEIRIDLSMEEIETRLKIEEILTAEQLEKLREKLKKPPEDDRRPPRDME